MEKKVSEAKLSPLQRKVVKAINDGAILITDNSERGATVAFERMQDNFRITNRCFNNMVQKGVICQMLSYPFDFVLTADYIKY